MGRRSGAAGHRLPAIVTTHLVKGFARKVPIHGVLGLLVGVLVLAFMGCGDDHKTEVTTVVNLAGDQEVPPRQTGGSGTATLTIDGDSKEIGYTLELRGQFTSPIQQAHIHSGVPGINGPIFLFLCTNLPPPSGVPTPPPCPIGAGTVSGTLTAANFIPVAGLSTFAEGVDAILAGKAYVNVHTQTNPGGEIRGQVPATPAF
jgi:hypothetical protein